MAIEVRGQLEEDDGSLFLRVPGVQLKSLELVANTKWAISVTQAGLSNITKNVTEFKFSNLFL